MLVGVDRCILGIWKSEIALARESHQKNKVNFVDRTGAAAFTTLTLTKIECTPIYS